MKKVLSYFFIVGWMVLLMGCRTINTTTEVSLNYIENQKQAQLIIGSRHDYISGKTYLINKDAKQYILFYDMNLNNDQVTYQVNDNKIQIIYETNNELSETYLYELIEPKESAVRYIQLIENGEDTPFESVIGR